MKNELGEDNDGREGENVMKLGKNIYWKSTQYNLVTE